MDIQLEILMFLQSIRSEILNAFFLILTISTEVPVIILFSALMYWCINKKYGQRLLFSIIGNFLVNTGIKEFVKAPRPIGIPGLESLRVSTATGHSFPSGHTQISTTFWTSLMILIKKGWMYIIGFIMILLVGISRLYLGVHWPIDVVFGWIFGILFSIIFIKVFDYVDENKKYGLLLLVLVFFAFIGYFLNSESYIEYLGILTGFILGYIIEDIFIGFSTETKNSTYINFNKSYNEEKPIVKLIKRFLIGMISLGVVYIILASLINIIPNYFEVDNLANFNIVANYIKYSIMVFYAVAGVPALFKVLKLDN